jgi:hypothetical protein
VSLEVSITSDTVLAQLCRNRLLAVGNHVEMHTAGHPRLTDKRNRQLCSIWNLSARPWCVKSTDQLCNSQCCHVLHTTVRELPLRRQIGLSQLRRQLQGWADMVSLDEICRHWLNPNLGLVDHYIIGTEQYASFRFEILRMLRDGTIHRGSIAKRISINSLESSHKLATLTYIIHVPHVGVRIKI